MQLCLNQEIINLKVTWTYTQKNLHERGHASLIHPGAACMITIRTVGPDIKGSRWVVFLLSVGWNRHPHTASGQHALILFISHSRRDRYRQCLCLEQSKIRQTSSGHGIEYCKYSFLHFSLTRFDILSWNFAHDFVLLYYRSTSSVVNGYQVL